MSYFPTPEAAIAHIHHSEYMFPQEKLRPGEVPGEYRSIVHWATSNKWWEVWVIEQGSGFREATLMEAVYLDRYVLEQARRWKNHKFRRYVRKPSSIIPHRWPRAAQIAPPPVVEIPKKKPGPALRARALPLSLPSHPDVLDDW